MDTNNKSNTEEEAALVRAVSIKAARALNLLSENKTLAQELILKARKNMADFPKFCAECEAFGLTNTQILMDIHQLIVKSTNKQSFTSAERLEPSVNTVGGLFRKRKSAATASQSESHNTSRYGLNVLAKELKGTTSVKKETHSRGDDEVDDDDVFTRAKGHRHHHQHRSSAAMSSGADSSRNSSNHSNSNSYVKTERGTVVGTTSGRLHQSRHPSSTSKKKVGATRCQEPMLPPTRTLTRLTHMCNSNHSHRLHLLLRRGHRFHQAQ